MSDQPIIKVERRTEFGKGAARSIRRNSQIPAVVYGGGEETIHIVMPGHQTMLATKVDNALLTMEFEGVEKLALVKDVQRDPIRPEIKHIDLVRVKRGEKVVVDVTVVTVDEAAPETLVNIEAQTLSIEVEATNIPELIEISVEGLEAGTQILASDVKLPAGATLNTDPETLVVNIVEPISAEALEAELEEAEEEAGIAKEEAEDATQGTGATKQQAEGDAPAEEPGAGE